MFDRKKITSLILGMALAASISAPMSFNAFADEVDSAMTEELELPTEESGGGEEDEDLIVSGDFKYSLSEDGVLSIQGYTGSEENLVIPDKIDGKTVEEIGDRAFFDTSLVSVTIPATVNYIADNPFMESKNLREIKVEEGNEYYFDKDGVLYLSRSGNVVLLSYPQGKEEEKFEIPQDVSTIGTSAVYDTNLKEISFPEGLSYIYRHGVSFNVKLEKVDLSGCKALSELTEMAFSGCTSLSEILFPENLGKIGDGAFAQCTSLKDVTLPERLQSIGQNAFAATGLTKIVIPSSVTEIGYCAFGYDENLEPLKEFVIIGDSGSVAETYATDEDEFYGYKNEFTFYDTSQADLIGESADLNIINGEEYMYAVKDDEIYIMSCLLTTPVIEIPETIEGKPVTCIYGAAFYQNEMTSVTIPDTVTKIGSIAFADCEHLESVKMPKDLVQIDKNAFAGCTALQYLEIPASCETIGEDAFYGCTALTEFKTPEDSKHFTVENGVLYTSDMTNLVAYPCGREDKYFKAPDTLKDISVSAFAGCENIQTADLSSVVNIGNYAFEKCTSLSSVKFTDKLRVVGDCAFYDCQALHKVRIYDNIEEIGNYAFGFHYEDSQDTLNEDFTIYANLDSGGIMYGLQNNIYCESDVSLYSDDGIEPAATFSIFGYNVRRGPVYAVCGAFGAAVIGAAAVVIIKKRSKKKAAGAPDAQGKEK